MADAREHAVHDAAGEEASCAAGLGRPATPSSMPCSATVGTVIGGVRGEPLLDAFEIGIAGRIAEAVAIGLDHDVDEVRIVERRPLRW